MEEFSGSNDQIIIKGKRTKRPRQSSSTSSSIEFYNLPSPTASSTCTEEDEDMANCLILLARSGNSPLPLEEEIKSPEIKITSRKFTEMPTSTVGKVGIYVYECKTCNRSFPSFQALGGHRASHKRPKLAGDITDDQKLLPEGQCIINTTVTSPPTSTKLVTKTFRFDQNKSKVHECSICGSEFGSGQALGGHMRRHRAAGTPNINNMGVGSGQVDNGCNILLDLNLPAPEDDRNFHQFAGKLVDCQY